MRAVAICAWLLLLGAGGAAAQENAAQEAARRAAVLAHLPSDAAQRAFGGRATPAAGPPEAIGAYERGCLEGAIALPSGPGLGIPPL